MYTVKTQNDLTKWWFIGTGSAVNRLSEVMDDEPIGPAIYYTTGWTASGNEYYRTQATANDACHEKIGAGNWSPLVLGSGIGLLNPGEYYYDAATTRLYVRLTGSVAPNATNQVRAHYLWDGSGAGPAFMTEVLEDKIYRVHLKFQIGDGTTATTLLSTNEYVYFDDDAYPETTANATLTLGVKVGNWSKDGSFWNFGGITGASYTFYLAYASSTLNVYASKFHCRTQTMVILNGALDVLNTIFSHSYSDDSSWKRCYNFNSSAIGTCSDLFFCNGTAIYVNTGSITWNDIRSHANGHGIWAQANGAVVRNLNITSNSQKQYYNQGNDFTRNLTVIDPTTSATSVTNYSTQSETDPQYGGWVKEQFSFNLKLVDEANNAINGATVILKDQFGTQCFSVTTDSSGVITEQLVDSKYWATVLETLTTYTPHTMEIRKSGYKTYKSKFTLSKKFDEVVTLEKVKNINLSNLAIIKTQ